MREQTKLKWFDETARSKEWALAKIYLNLSSHDTKFSRKANIECDRCSRYHTHSFIKFDDKILAVAGKGEGDDRFLGKGSFASVKLAEDEDGTVFALKIKTKDNDFNDEMEAKIAYKMGAAFFERIIIRREKIYILYKYLGISLKKYLKENSLNKIQQLEFGMKIAECIASLHAAGYAHLDLKPDNITVDEKGNINLIDYGMSASLGRSQYFREIIFGTPFYLPTSPSYISFDLLDNFALLRTLLLKSGVTYNSYNPCNPGYPSEVEDEKNQEDGICLFDESVFARDEVLNKLLDTRDGEVTFISASEIAEILGYYKELAEIKLLLRNAINSYKNSDDSFQRSLALEAEKLLETAEKVESNTRVWRIPRLTEKLKIINEALKEPTREGSLYKGSSLYKKLEPSATKELQDAMRSLAYCVGIVVAAVAIASLVLLPIGISLFKNVYNSKRKNKVKKEFDKKIVAFFNTLENKQSKAVKVNKTTEHVTRSFSVTIPAKITLGVC